MEYLVKIDDFEGPLDLLLHLVSISNINIYDINICEITNQYMEYIHQWEKLNIDITSSYLVMAATLMEIKSKSLLPKENITDVDGEDEEEISREVLIQKLIEYQKYKEVTKEFKNLELDRKNIHTKAPENLNEMFEQKFVNDTDTTVDDLMNAFMEFLKRKNMERPVITRITNKEYSVKRRKNDIRKFLNERKKIEFTELFHHYNKGYIIVTFLAILELAHEEEVVLVQEKNFSKILIEQKV